MVVHLQHVSIFETTNAKLAAKMSDKYAYICWSKVQANRRIFRKHELVKDPIIATLKVERGASCSF